MYLVHEARGGIRERQLQANELGAQCFVDIHLNSVADSAINYGFVIVGQNASARTEEWAHIYLELLEEKLGQGVTGVLRGVRGSGNVRWCRCPSMLVEPGMISNPEFADRIRTGEGIDGLAWCIAESIRRVFPDPAVGPVVLSPGHAHRDGDMDPSTGDPGALMYDHGDEMTDPDFDTEAELNCEVVRSATEMLEAG